MSVNVEIQGADNHGHIASVNVTPLGQLVTAPFSYDEVVSAADRTIGASGVLIEVYESSAEDSLVVDKSIMNIDLLKNTSRDVVGLNLLVTEGKYLNVKCDDTDVSVTLMGYYVPTFQSEHSRE